MTTIDTDIRRLAGHTTYESLGASWTEQFGWLLPNDFGDVPGECRALQKHCGLIDKSYFGRIRVTGDTAQDFLHRMTSAPINNLAEGEGMETVVTTAEGRFVDWVTTYRTGEKELVLITGPGAADHVIEHLKGYLFFKDHVEFEQTENDWSLLQLSGPGSLEVVQNAFQVRLSTEEKYRLHTIGDPENGITVTRTNEITDCDIQLFFPNQSGELIWENLRSAGVSWSPVGYQAYQIARVSAGIPQYPAEINDRHLAPEAHLDSPVDLDSCFAGQEVIARTINYDKIKQHLCHLEIFGASEEALTAPADIYREDQRIGELTSTVWSPQHNKHLGLGYIRTRYLEDNLSMMVDQLSKRVSGTIIQKTRSR